MQLPDKSIRNWPVLKLFLAASSFILTFQAYLVAPLIPFYVVAFKSPLMNYVIPVYALPFAAGAVLTAFMKSGGAKPRVLIWSVLAMSLGCFLLAGSRTVVSFLIVRAMTGLFTGAIIPAALLLISSQPDNHGKRSGILLVIFSLAAGMTFGPVTGGWLNHIIGWRSLYTGAGVLSALVFLSGAVSGGLSDRYNRHTVQIFPPFACIQRIISSRKLRKVNSFVYLTGTFHSGVFVWISYYFADRYHLSEPQLALALLVFGLPGLVAVIIISGLDRQGSVRGQLYAGLVLVMCSILILLTETPFWAAAILVTLLSVGYNLTQPLFVGIIKAPLTGQASRTAAALGVGILFLGYGTGPLFMIYILHYGKAAAILFLGILAFMLYFFSLRLWSSIALKKENRSSLPLRES